MKTEIQILKTNLQNIYDPGIINYLCRNGYKLTGNKFSISFNGSKGYFNNVEIYCEGIQIENNKLEADEIFNKKGSIKKKLINVFYSESKGVRVSLGADKPRVV